MSLLLLVLASLAVGTCSASTHKPKAKPPPYAAFIGEWEGACFQRAGNLGSANIACAPQILAQPGKVTYSVDSNGKPQYKFSTDSSTITIASGAKWTVGNDVGISKSAVYDSKTQTWDVVYTNGGRQVIRTIIVNHEEYHEEGVVQLADQFGLNTEIPPTAHGLLTPITCDATKKLFVYRCVMTRVRR